MSDAAAGTSTEKSATRLSRNGLEALFNVSKALNSTLEVEEVLQTMLGMALDTFQADAGSVMLLQDGYLTIQVSQGLEPEIVAKTRQKLGTGIAGWVAKTGQPLHLDGKVEDSRFETVVKRQDSITSSLSVPIATEGDILGVLMIRRVGEQMFELGSLAFLESIADLAAVALQKAKLYQAEKAHRHQLEFSHQKLSATFSSMADGVLVFDQQGSLSSSNSVAEKFLAPILGQELQAFGRRFPELLQLEQGELQSGDRLLRVVRTPLVVRGEENGSVFVLRDESVRREVERMKSEFLSMVSHELKTPITTISAFVELLLERNFEPERRSHFLNICRDECTRLQSLIDQLLHLTRLEAGRFELERKLLDLSVLVQEALPAFEGPNPQHRFVLRECPQAAPFEGDATLLRQSIVNLLSNAVKYSPDGGEVVVGLRSTPSSYLLSVKDEGVGIEAEKLEFVFEKFYRADNSLTRATGGTGLGLANVKHIALAHSGRVWAESELGKGSCFYLELPREAKGA